MAERCIAVLGSGAGARACAADLALAGWEVRLWELPRFAANLEPLMREPRLVVSGLEHCEVELEAAGTDLRPACEGAAVVLVVTQALAHAEIAGLLAELVREEQVIVISPGSTGGALEFAHLLRQGRGAVPTIAETATLAYAARAVGPRGVLMRLRVKLVKTAALPAGETQRIVDLLRPAFPGLEPARSVLETALSNGNPVIHPAVMLTNAGLVQRMHGNWEFYSEGVTPAVADLIRALDEERLALGRAMGLDLLPEPEMSVRQGYAESADYLVCYRDGSGFQGLGGPGGLEHRYLTEDVAYGLVTMLELGGVFGVELPTMAAVVRIASVLLGRDFWAESRRGLARLGLAGMNPERILAHCQ